MPVPSRIRKSFGGLLIEWSTATSLIATTAMFAVPGLRTFVHESQRSAVVNDLQLEVRRAQIAANEAGRPVTLCARDASGHGCADDGNWSRGWTAFVDADGDGAMSAAESRHVLWQTRNSHPNIAVTASPAAFSFMPYYARMGGSTTGTIDVCDRERNGGARTIRVGGGGVPALSDVRHGGCA